MVVICNHSNESGHHALLRRERRSGIWLAVALLPLIAGCTATQLGPARPIAVEEDVANIRGLAEPDLSLLGVPSVAARNQIITARMYIADLEYHKYEAKLTRDLQEEGLAATLAILGLTSAATLVEAASTKTILSATATAVTGADKAFSDKVLLSNTIQALQAQMRADRQTQAAAIFLRMATPVDQYTLPMALSDVDKYYQAGTLASALIGLNKTVANAEQNASTAHDLASPNGAMVSEIKTIANPPPTTTRAAIVASPNIASITAPPRRVFVAPVANDPSVAQLRALLFTNGKPDPALRAYVQGLIGANVAIGPILTTGPRFASLRVAISACILQHNAGHDCAPGSLADQVK